MPVATPEQYADMLGPREGRRLRVPRPSTSSSSQTINAVLQGLTEAGSDGIIQVTTGGADYFAGHDRQGLARPAPSRSRSSRTEVAKSYPITVALHTDHCPKDGARTASCCRSSRRRRKRSRPAATRSSSRTCGTARPSRSTRTSRSPKELLPRAQDHQRDPRGRDRRRRRRRGRRQARGLERGALHDPRPTSPKAVEALGLGENGRYIAALTFGNVHGVYKPGNVKLAPGAARRDPGGHRRSSSAPARSRSTSSSTAARGSTDEEIAVAVAQRRRQDEHRHRHAVRLHPLGRRLHVPELRRRPQGRRRGRATRSPTTRAPGARSPSPAMAARVVEATQQLGSATASPGLGSSDVEKRPGPRPRHLVLFRSMWASSATRCAVRARDDGECSSAPALTVPACGRRASRAESPLPSEKRFHPSRAPPLRRASGRRSGTACAASSPRPRRAVADAPALADHGGVDVHAGDAEVLAEPSGRHRGRLPQKAASSSE